MTKRKILGLSVFLTLIGLTIYYFYPDDKFSNDIQIDNITEYKSKMEFSGKNIVKISFPDWLQGGWQNLGQSNTNNIIFWIFANDTIIYRKGFHGKKEVLNEKYADYERYTDCSDNEFQIHFIKEEDTIIYKFRLEKVEWTNERTMSYSLKINNIEIVKHTTGMALLFHMEELNNRISK